jgi:hypothetical protein
MHHLEQLVLNGFSTMGTSSVLLFLSALGQKGAMRVNCFRRKRCARASRLRTRCVATRVFRFSCFGRQLTQQINQVRHIGASGENGFRYRGGRRFWAAKLSWNSCFLKNPVLDFCHNQPFREEMVADRSRVDANMEVVLEDHCRALPHGGDHEYRKFIAERLKQCVASGKTTLGDLEAAARRAETEFRNKGA